ncbi:MAG TPA: YggT family protein [Candidatus Tectomicrobia bacterium]
MGGPAGNLIVDLLDLIINIYIILLFMRMFLTEYERYDSILDMVFQATDPIVGPLANALGLRAPQLTPLLVIAVLLLFKGMIIGSIPGAVEGFISTLLKIYVLTIIITATFREAYLNPIVNLGQRMVRPVRRLVTHLSPQPLAVNVLAVVVLVVLHSLALFVLRGDEPVLLKNAFIDTLRIIVDLTWFFVLVLFLYVILSWFSPDPRNPLVQLLTLIAIPILEPIRRVIPSVGGVIDLSPILGMFALQIVNAVLRSVLNAL